jgi:hypothetical protein
MTSSQFHPQKCSAMVKCFLPIVAFALVVFSMSPTVLAGDSFNFRGPTADAFFSSTETSGCVITDVFVFANDERLHDAPGPGTLSSVATVSISQYNSCAGTQLMAAFGEASLAAEDFQVAKGLNSATLNTTIQVFDFISGNTFNVDLALNWTATGDPANIKDHFHFRAPGQIENFRFSGTFRPAQASGTVSDRVTNFTPGPTSSAETGSVKNGAVVIN